MLDCVTFSIMFTTVSPDPFTPVTRAQCESALICEKNGEPMTDLPISVSLANHYITTGGMSASVVTRMLAEHKTKEESVRREKEKAIV